MRVTTRAVKKLCGEVSLPEEMVDRHIDELTELVLRTATRTTNKNQNRIRAWMFSKDLVKPNLLDVLRQEDEADLM